MEPCAAITGNAEGVIATLPEPLVLHPLILSAMVLEPLKLSQFPTLYAPSVTERPVTWTDPVLLLFVILALSATTILPLIT
jgi:hypothetical protein